MQPPAMPALHRDLFLVSTSLATGSAAACWGRKGSSLAELKLFTGGMAFKNLFYLDCTVYKMSVTEETFTVLLPPSCAVTPILGSKQYFKKALNTC